MLSQIQRVVRSAVLVSLMSVLAPRIASAQLVNFESLGYGPACQWGGGSAFSSLGGKTWNGLRPLDLNNLSVACGRATNTGYSLLQGAFVGNVIALGSGAAWMSSGSPFTLTSLVAGAGWLNPTTLTLDFYLNTVKQGSSVLSLNTSQTGASVFGGAQLFAGASDFIMFTPDYTGGADVFNSAAESCIGATAPCVEAPYQSWFVDNLQFAPVSVVTTAPEPGTVGMVVFGLAALAGAARRRKRAA